MEDANSVDAILEYLQKNGFSRALTALKTELNNCADRNGPEKLMLEEARRKKVQEENAENLSVRGQDTNDFSKELIVKEIECGTSRNGKESKQKSKSTSTPTTECVSPIEVVASEKSFAFSKSSEDPMLDLYPCINGSSTINPANFCFSEGINAGKISLRPNDEIISSANADTNFGGKRAGELKDEIWSIDEVPNSSSSQKKGCMIKNVFLFPNMDVPTTSSSKEVSGKTDMDDIRAAIKEQADEIGKSLYLAKLQGISDTISLDDVGLALASENQMGELPRLPPVRLKSIDKPLNTDWSERFDHDGLSLKFSSGDGNYLIDSYLDVPVEQEVNSAGDKRMGGGDWLSISHGISEDTSDMVSGFATVGDGPGDYPNDFWDSDEYDDDDDVGYTRQPIEDETWFLAHEIDYPSDNEKTTGHGSIPDPQERVAVKVKDDERSFADDDSYFSGEQYIQAKQMEPISASDDPIGLSITEVYDGADENEIMAHYDGQLMDEEEFNLMRSEPVWQGFVRQSDDLIVVGDGKIMNECRRVSIDDGCVDDDQHGSVRSIGVGINSDIAETRSELRESLINWSSEGDLEFSQNPQMGIPKDSKKANEYDNGKYVLENDKGCVKLENDSDVGFSFAPPIIEDIIGDVRNHGSSNLSRTDGMLGSWTYKSSTCSPDRSPRDEGDGPIVRSADSTPTISERSFAEKEHVKKDDEERDVVKGEDIAESLEDEEAVAVQEQVRQIKSQEEEFETFSLKIVHRKNRTGFEEDKNFHVVLNSVIAGRYHVTEYLGSAAFSKAIQAHDLHTGMDVCIKIIKNNKDFFDQSLDEIKLLKFVNKHDPGDKFHLLRLYDYFYYREHLLIVCELLKANLYEFHKFNRESGGEVYFTMPRLQSITIQILEALKFLHSLGLIHCDLKPENILVKSYSRCEVKVIDLGSSCFETDHLCSYVQSRSYRAPEVILGLPYDKKIDVWSLGCILAELCTGNVLFQNDSPATLLARVIGIIGPIDDGMLANGKDTYKYFTKNHMLYERNQETNRVEYLIQKKSLLRYRIPMGDEGFVDFVSHLLQLNPKKRPSAGEALNHPWLSYAYEPISS